MYDENNEIDYNNVDLVQFENEDKNIVASDIHKESILYARPYYCQIYMRMTPKYVPYMFYKNTIKFEWDLEWPDLILLFDFAYFE